MVENLLLCFFFKKAYMVSRNKGRMEDTDVYKAFLCVNKGKDFIAPPDRERLDQIVILTSNLHQKQNMAPKNDSDVQQVGELLTKAVSHAAHIHDSLSNSELFHHSRAKRETASPKRLTSKRQKSGNYFHKAHHRQVQRNNLRIFMTHLH